MVEENEMEEEGGNTDQNWGAGNACDRYAATGGQEETCPRQNASKRQQGGEQLQA